MFVYGRGDGKACLYEGDCKCRCHSRESTIYGKCEDQQYDSDMDLYAFSAENQNRPTKLFICLTLMLIFKVLS